MSDSPTLSRRTLAAGAAWSAPMILAARPAPAVTASLQKDPGINGWVLNTRRPLSYASGAQAQSTNAQPMASRRWSLEVDSTLARRGPDGAPYGLYVYDTTDDMVISEARLVYWIIGEQKATWETLGGHSPFWSSPSIGVPTKKRDGFIYTPYTWEYTGPINPRLRQRDADGVERLYLGDFHVHARFTQSGRWVDNVTYWTQRFITIDGEELTFERRNGTLGSIFGASGASTQTANTAETMVASS